MNKMIFALLGVFALNQTASADAPKMNKCPNLATYQEKIQRYRTMIDNYYNNHPGEKKNRNPGTLGFQVDLMNQVMNAYRNTAASDTRGCHDNEAALDSLFRKIDNLTK